VERPRSGAGLGVAQKLTHVSSNVARRMPAIYVARGLAGQECDGSEQLRSESGRAADQTGGRRASIRRSLIALSHVSG